MNAVLISVLEILAVGFTIWCLFNEEILARFERRVFCFFRRKKMKVIRGGRKNNKNYA